MFNNRPPFLLPQISSLVSSTSPALEHFIVPFSLPLPIPPLRLPVLFYPPLCMYTKSPLLVRSSGIACHRGTVEAPDPLPPVHALPSVFTTFVLLKIVGCSSTSCILDYVKSTGGRILSLKSNHDAQESSSHYMNEFDCAQGRRQWHGEDPGLCSSSRRNESQQPVPLLTNGKQFQVLGEIPITTPDNLSVRSKSGPLDPGDKHVGYLDTRQPGFYFIWAWECGPEGKGRREHIQDGGEYYIAPIHSKGTHKYVNR
ncbi:uncharacterized protein LOC111917653 [Lactuca sativa]|uniref:uncharacterized protein LOC111917653 n=1 Tax=Lactuca sativa TaxID=4236 RepID=UPI000CA83A5B|nr:uncharacterized protein LOC111917653 [Lactuca sativa]